MKITVGRYIEPPNYCILRSIRYYRLHFKVIVVNCDSKTEPTLS